MDTLHLVVDVAEMTTGRFREVGLLPWIQSVNNSRWLASGGNIPGCVNY